VKARSTVLLTLQAKVLCQDAFTGRSVNIIPDRSNKLSPFMSARRQVAATLDAMYFFPAIVVSTISVSSMRMAISLSRSPCKPAWEL
jgi:hypothetical protein